MDLYRQFKPHVLAHDFDGVLNAVIRVKEQGASQSDAYDALIELYVEIGCIDDLNDSHSKTCNTFDDILDRVSGCCSESNRIWPDSLSKPSTWRDNLIDWMWTIGLAPIGIPLAIVSTVFLWLRTRTYVWRSIDSAWGKCARCWKSVGVVQMYAEHDFNSNFYHDLAVALGKAHRRNSEFFLDQLRNPDPILVGYAFKCLIRAKPNLRIEDISNDVLDRTDMIPTCWADLGRTERVGDFIKDFFAE